MSDRLTGIPLRCYCSRKPLLATFGRDEETGEPVVHIKSWKGARLYVEAVVVSGVVRLKCRECLKWNTVKIIKGEPSLKEYKGDPLQYLD